MEVCALWMCCSFKAASKWNCECSLCNQSFATRILSFKKRLFQEYNSRSKTLSVETLSTHVGQCAVKEVMAAFHWIAQQVNHPFVGNNVVLENCLSLNLNWKAALTPWEERGEIVRNERTERLHRRKTHISVLLLLSMETPESAEHTLARASLRFNYSIVRWRRNSSAFSISN